MNAPDPIEFIPPYAIEAEEAVLGGILRNNEAYDRVAGVLGADDFYVGENREVFRAAQALIASGKLADPITCAQWLKDRGKLPEGRFSEISDMEIAAPALVNIGSYAAIVRETSIRRAVIAAADEMRTLAHAGRGMESRAILDQAQNLLARVDERSHRGEGTFRAMPTVLAEVLAQLDEQTKGNTSLGVTTGFSDLDRTLNPMLPGQLIVVGARPAVGKTSFAVNVAVHAALSQRVTVGMFSMEMTDIEIALRVLSAEAQIPAGRFREHRMGESQWNAIGHAMQRLADLPFHIDHSGGLSIQDLTARARIAAKQVGGFGLLLVDYVQLSRAEGRYDNRAVEIGAVTSGLKRLAKELRCPVIALSQLNRDSAKEGKRPMVSELRDSGSIEADADTILLLHRPYVFSQREDVKFDAEVIIGKQRNGQIGTVDLDYDHRFTQFFNHGRAPGRNDRAH